MIGIHSGVSAYSGFHSLPRSAPIHSIPAAPIVSRRTGHSNAPVQPVRAVPPVTADVSGNINLIRRGADPAEMAVRLRIRYID